MPEPRQERHRDTSTPPAAPVTRTSPELGCNPCRSRGDDREHGREPGGADRHRPAGAGPPAGGPGRRP
jgi:hypothetical protein